MPLILILEDFPADLRVAANIAQRAGFTEFEVTAFATDARKYLENAMDGKAPLPDAMIVDLDLGQESGFELIRFWHKTLKTIPLIVWTVMGEQQREICALFGVNEFVHKEDENLLLESLSTIVAAGMRTAQRCG
ncbi:MAG TPA: response regulator [Acidobacteriaceae bacterium]|nr:response regulator [Acidobacteriaceae bacterium]